MKKVIYRKSVYAFVFKVSLTAFAAALFFTGCNNPVKNSKGSNSKEEFAVSFATDGDGGKLTAKIEGGSVINSGTKVQKDKTVIFTATANSGKQVSSWTLNGKPVNGTAKEYRLTITEAASVKVKFKNEGSPALKKIQIDKISLGYPNISDKDGKTVDGASLNSNTVIPDFEVPDSKFPVMILHKTEFTAEQIFITFDGGTREEVNPGAGGKGLIAKDFTLTENKKTPFVIEITADKYEPIKLSFSVTYKKPSVKSLDNVTHIQFTTNKDGSKKAVYGAASDKNLSLLADGNEVLNVSAATPKLTVTLMKSEGQPNAQMKLNNAPLAGDFPAGSSKLEMDLPPLNMGENPFEITLSKPGYETKTYKLKLNYKPLLSLKNLVVNGKVFSMPFPKPITLEASDANPVTLSAEANESGAVISFKKNKVGSKWIDVTPPVSVSEGQTLKMRVYLKKDGYIDTYFSFSLKRKEAVKAIEFKNIKIDGTTVTAGNSVTVEKTEASATIEVYLKQFYNGISFTVNDVPKTPDMDTSNTIATFRNFPLTANAANTIKIKAEAPDFTGLEQTITINHTTPASSGTGYIEAVKVFAYDFDEKEFFESADLKKENGNWKGTVDSDSIYKFVIKVNANGKDLSDITKFKIYMKNITNDTVYTDGRTGKKDGENTIKFELKQTDTQGDIKLKAGENTIEVKILYDTEMVETCNFIIKA